MEGQLSQLRLQPPQIAQPARGRRTRNRRRRRAGRQGNQSAPSIRSVNPTDVMLGKLELCEVIKVEATKTTASGKCSLQVGDFAYLKNIGKCFERIRWLSVRVIYKPAVAMTTAGMVSFGVDWNWSGQATTRKTISSYTPTVGTTVWKEAQLVLPASRLQSRLWYSIATPDTVESGPGQVCWAVDASGGQSGLTVGELWIEYRVLFSGTTS